MPKQTLKICPNGHQFYKSSDCPVCPTCEKERKPAAGFLSMLSAPARRAMENNKVTTVEKLSNHTEKEILQWHGVGKTSIPKLKQALQSEGLDFKPDK